uniref:Rieske (2Fe-2S) protein n=1 Tax=Ornithinicoccus halotolerans TaxID=1748220 RepID=UPI0012965661
CAGGGSGGEPAAPGGTDGSGDRARVPLADVPVGSATYLEDAQVLVARPEEGSVVAFDATCPHQGCRVSLVQGELLVCPCHGSRFQIGTGGVVEGPAETGLTELAVEVDGDDVRVSG